MAELIDAVADGDFDQLRDRHIPVANSTRSPASNSTRYSYKASRHPCRPAPSGLRSKRHADEDLTSHIRHTSYM